MTATTRSRVMHEHPTRAEWNDLIRAEPHLAKILAEIMRMKPTDPDFCANAAWYGYGGYPGFKKRMCQLVGYDARNPELRTSKAYSAAYSKLYDAMPDCQHEGGLC